LSLAAARSASQQLHRPAAIREPVDVVRESGPVQAQEPRAARLAFRARSRNLTATEVDRARTDERSLLRAWCMRKTVHLIAREDAGWLLPLFAPIIVRWSRRRLAQFGLDARGQERALAVLHDAVGRDGPLTRPELGERLERAGFDAANELKVHLWLLATLDGELCLGPDCGGHTCLVRTEDWIGVSEPHPRDESLAELARRYLRGYGPADERDLARWAGLPLRDARAGFERIGGELEPAGALFTLGRASRRPRGPVVRLLGAFDNYNLGYVDRGFALAREHERQVVPGGGIVRPAIVVDGHLVGTWSSRRSGERLAVSIEPFGALEPEIGAAIAAEVDDVGRFEAVAATMPRP
jgi:hypothetical protein